MSEDFVCKDEIKPGIINSLLSLVAKHGQCKSHKLCIDGKKINASTEHEMGQIYSFGYEHAPTAENLKKYTQRNEIN